MEKLHLSTEANSKLQKLFFFVEMTVKYGDTAEGFFHVSEYASKGDNCFSAYWRLLVLKMNRDYL